MSQDDILKRVDEAVGRRNEAEAEAERKRQEARADAQRSKERSEAYDAFMDDLVKQVLDQAGVRRDLELVKSKYLPEWGIEFKYTHWSTPPITTHSIAQGTITSSGSSYYFRGYRLTPSNGSNFICAGFEGSDPYQSYQIEYFGPLSSENVAIPQDRFGGKRGARINLPRLPSYFLHGDSTEGQATIRREYLDREVLQIISDCTKDGLAFIFEYFKP